MSAFLLLFLPKLFVIFLPPTPTSHPAKPGACVSEKEGFWNSLHPNCLPPAFPVLLLPHLSAPPQRVYVGGGGGWRTPQYVIHVPRVTIKDYFLSVERSSTSEVLQPPWGPHNVEKNTEVVSVSGNSLSL
ncbi:hypothetical protein CEXT_181441 [Caerostris extrusa]|uniref:Secreted protein n=1 Tax=Caerostris extrusa TaxID=172846 RepID=A0AAV4WWF0_CAEEX|nr:hypothetical protein CEXT_181441 [Caerostris extrusa]